MTQDRRAKAQAAATASGTGPNKIIVATVVAVLAIVAVVGGVIWNQSRQTASTPTAVGTDVPTGSAMGRGFTAFQSVTPKAGAPVVKIYEDFLCPGCGQFETSAAGATIRDLAAQGRIVLEYHVLNFLDQRFGVQASTPVGNGAFCAERQGRFQQFHDHAYAHQLDEGKDIPIATIREWGAASGVPDAAAFTTCVEAGTFTTWLNRSTEAARTALGAFSTPTVIVGEVRYDSDPNSGHHPFGADYADLVAALQKVAAA